ncbi:hypothetical protein M003_18395 [Pseudomonas aeruginosa IGB83]|nr:hypothetical protein M003_18395 [Pseudomonas aeruginosa IGB83]
MVFVVHAGELEIKSAVLAASLRKRFGFSMDIIAACPSGKADWGVPSDASRRLYERLGIPLLPMDSPFGPEYPIGNKFAALALGPAVGHTLFLDSDMICVDAFEADMLCRFDAALKPADMALVAKQNDYWERIYAHAGSALPGDRVVTTCSGEAMPAYYNAGFILVRDARRFAEVWYRLAERVHADPLITNKMPWLDQLTLPVALHALNYKTRALSERFNYPLHIKPLSAASLPPFFCHYHSLDTLVSERSLWAELDELAKRFPELREVLALDANWKKAILAPAPRLAFSEGDSTGTVEAGQDLVITGIPRSGTSHLCRLLSQQPDTVVLNEPPQVFEALKLSPLPWGLPRYYAELRRDILAGRPVPNKHVNGRLVDDTARGNDQSSGYFAEVRGASFHLGTKNTLAYIARLPLIRKVMPTALLIATIRHPYDSLNSWANTFEHLRQAAVERQPFGCPDDLALTGWQRKALLAIADTDHLAVRRALWWRYLALQLEDAGDYVQLLRYEDFVEAPQTTLAALRNNRPLPFDEPAVWSKGLAPDEQELVANIVCDVAERFHYVL